MLFGSGMFAMLGIGIVLVAGPLVAWIVAGLEGAVVVGGVGAIGGGLASIGIPKMFSTRLRCLTPANFSCAASAASLSATPKAFMECSNALLLSS